jgi:tetratricopeptide (TPR) repeat protein
MQSQTVQWLRNSATEMPNDGPHASESDKKHRLRTLAVSIARLGTIQRENNNSNAIASYKEANKIYRQIDDIEAEGTAAFNLGTAFMNIASVLDLDEAERWLMKSLDLYKIENPLGRGLSFFHLGVVSYRRFEQARQDDKPLPVLLEHLNSTIGLLNRALQILPTSSFFNRSGAYNLLGAVYFSAGPDYIDKALSNYRLAIRDADQLGDKFLAGQIRYNVAASLLANAREHQEERTYVDARSYAQAALELFRDAAPGSNEIDSAQKMLADLDQEIAALKQNVPGRS